MIACAWDDEQNVSILLDIDEQAGTFQSLATLPKNLRFSGLADSASGLAGVTRALKTNASAIYVIDEEDWTAEHLVDLPAPCEALGSGYGYGWIAAGERVFNVIGTDVTEWTIYPEGEIGTIVGLGDWFSFSAVEPVTWGRIKQQFR